MSRILHVYQYKFNCCLGLTVTGASKQFSITTIIRLARMFLESKIL